MRGCGLQSAVVDRTNIGPSMTAHRDSGSRLELLAIDHAPTAAGLSDEAGTGIAGFGHRVHVHRGYAESVTRSGPSIGWNEGPPLHPVVSSLT
jgi:hypothetical protein